MDRYLIANLIPREICSILPVSEASTIFCWNLIDNACFQKVIGIVHTTIKDTLELQDTKRVSFVQHRKIPHSGVGRVLNNLLDSVSIIKKCRKADSIWFYNLEWTQVLSYLFLKLLGKKIYIIVADFTPPLKRISYACLTKYLIEHSNGLITLSSRSIFHHKNQMSIAGIVSPDDLEKRSRMLNPHNKNFLFSGGLEPIHGIDLAIQVFAELPEAQLYITGKHLDYDISRMPNIHYLGYLSRKEYDNLFKDMSCCLSFRNPKYPENFNNFPSKILEYLTYNKDVVSTMEYPELYNIPYISTNYDVISVKETIRDYLSSIHEEKDIKTTLLDYYGPQKWIRTMAFVERDN